MRMDVITLFPGILEGALNASILHRGRKEGRFSVHLHQLRDYTHDRHRTVDDRPFGGGPGMVLKCEPVVEAIESIQSMAEPKAHAIHLTPSGKTFTQADARRLSALPRLLFLSGHYEGVDNRVREGGWIDEELSIGNYILTNGTLAALVIIDAVARLIPGVLGNDESPENESFSDGETLEGPHYTRPEIFRGLRVPEILLSGNHAAIAKWREEKGRERTEQLRQCNQSPTQENEL